MSKTQKKNRTDKGKILFAHASVRSLGGTSLFAVAPDDIRPDNVTDYFADEAMTSEAVRKLEANGFDVLQVSDATISIAAPIATFERVFNTTITGSEEPVVKELGKETTAEFFDSSDTDKAGLIDTSSSDLAGVLEGVSINEPVYYFANQFAPTKAY